MCRQIDVAYNGERQQLTPEQVTGAMLTHLKTLAEGALETKVVDCVIGVPPFFTDKMRRALLDAAAIAGLNGATAEIAVLATSAPCVF